VDLRLQLRLTLVEFEQGAATGVRKLPPKSVALATYLVELGREIAGEFARTEPRDGSTTHLEESFLRGF
jgi:hypothetical protein